MFASRVQRPHLQHVVRYERCGGVLSCRDAYENLRLLCPRVGRFAVRLEVQRHKWSFPGVHQLQQVIRAKLQKPTTSHSALWLPNLTLDRCV